MKRTVCISSIFIILLVLAVLPDINETTPYHDYKDLSEIGSTTLFHNSLWVENITDEIPGDIWNQIFQPLYRYASGKDFKPESDYCLSQRSILNPLFLDRPPPRGF